MCGPEKHAYVWRMCKGHRRDQPGAGVTHGPTDVVLGPKPRSSARGASALNYCTTSQVLSFLSFLFPLLSTLCSLFLFLSFFFFYFWPFILGNSYCCPQSQSSFSSAGSNRLFILASVFFHLSLSCCVYTETRFKIFFSLFYVTFVVPGTIFFLINSSTAVLPQHIQCLLLKWSCFTYLSNMWNMVTCFLFPSFLQCFILFRPTSYYSTNRPSFLFTNSVL